MKKKYKRILIVFIFALVFTIGYMLYNGSLHNHNHNHNHTHEGNDKDGCMCECEFDSNQNETSCKEHGGCEWINNQCVTEK